MIFGLKSVAAKAATAATVPTPLMWRSQVLNVLRVLDSCEQWMWRSQVLNVLCALDSWEQWMWRSQVLNVLCALDSWEQLNEADALVCQNGISSGSNVPVMMLLMRSEVEHMHQQQAN